MSEAEATGTARAAAIRDEHAQSSLALVSHELHSTLEAARREIEAYLDDASSTESLQRAAGMLHLAGGALKIVELHGPALLAEEIEQACQRMIEIDDADEIERGVDVLTRAMVQLPAYLERLEQGGRDVALVLLPLLNELREFRRKPLLSEGTLLVLGSGPMARPTRAVAASSEVGVDAAFRETAMRQRPRFQAALLGLIRGERVESNLDQLIAVSTALERVSGADEIRQLWEVLTAVLAALRDHGLSASVTLKRLIGQTDRQLKRLIDAGVTASAEAPPVELVNSLLYYVARAKSEDERVLEVRRKYNLDETVPRDDQIEQAREDMAGPSIKLLRTVAEAIKEDLAKVKDVLDIFVRTGMGDAAELKPQLEMLKKISDTLGVLGLESSRSRIQQQSEQLVAIIGGGGADPAALEQVAATMLEIEDALDRELLSASAPDRGAAAAEDEEREQYRHVTQAVVAECIVNLSKIKDVVTRIVDGAADVRAVDQVAPELKGIVAGLLMLNKTRAVGAVERIGAVITRRLAPGQPRLKADYLERLADAIVSVEYYMETISHGRSDPWYMLDNAERCIELLEELPAGALEAEPAAGEPRSEPAEAGEPAAAAETPAPAPAGADAESEAAAPRAVPRIGDERSDPEILEVFIEEAKEELANVHSLLPLWLEEIDNREALVPVRRSFHTIKGSGRTVGAERLAEFAWSIENLLNKVINETLEPTTAITELVGEAVKALPQLIDELELGIAPTADIERLMRHADALAAGDPDAARLASEPPPASTPAPEAAESGAQVDPVLTEIFVKETRGHLAAITAFLEDAERRPAPHAITEPMYRACHTLLGSARMAGYRSAIELTRPLHEQVSRRYEQGLALSSGELGLLREAANEIERMAATLEAGERYTANAELAERVDALSTTAPAAPAAPAAAEPEPEAAAEPEPPAARTPAPEAEIELELEPEIPGFDPEIAGIFADEAAEILEQAETTLHELRAVSVPAEDGLNALKRQLHTLKGGARMAGAESMADLSHALETLLAGIVPERAPLSAAVLDLIQRCLDHLHTMRDAAGAGRLLGVPGRLLGQIEALAANGPGLSAASSAVAADEPQPASADAAAAPGAAAEPASPPAPSEPQPAHAAPAPGAETPPPRQPRVSEDEAEEAPTSIEPLPRPSERIETARVSAELLDTLLNGAGEISIFQSRLNQQMQSVEFHLGELGQTVTRLREQLRKLEAETEAQILNRHQDDVEQDAGFDPLELDRYSTIQQLSRALAETANDVASINELLYGLTTETGTLLTQQSRVTAELQDGLMQTRMVSFQRHVARLARIVRQASAEAGKQAELVVEGGESEIDRQLLDSVLPALEHLLRNAVVHGIEAPDARRAAGKPETGRVELRLRREGTEVLIDVADDGTGLDLAAIRRKAVEQRLIDAAHELGEDEVRDLILRPGFSTAGHLTLAAGRGVGMDVVDTEVKKLGGSLRIESKPGAGTRFVIRLPYTLAITHALIVNVGDETFALPLPTVEGVTRVSRDQLLETLTTDDPRLDYGDVSYRVQHLGSLVGSAPSALGEDDNAVPLVLVRAGEHSTALLADSIEGSREIVVKTLGPHLLSVPGVSGATILGDGRIIVILDPGTLVRRQTGDAPQEAHLTRPAPPSRRELTALVVDDSITMRRVTQRLLERRGARVLTARDGLDAISVLQDNDVDVILLDIEMPRMDGYQFASHVRNDPRLKDLPIIMVTSRSSEKHRARAIEIGVNDYLSKPYQESQLVRSIEGLIGRSL